MDMREHVINQQLKILQGRIDALLAENSRLVREVETAKHHGSAQGADDTAAWMANRIIIHCSNKRMARITKVGGAFEVTRGTIPRAQIVAMLTAAIKDLEEGDE